MPVDLEDDGAMNRLLYNKIVRFRENKCENPTPNSASSSS